VAKRYAYLDIETTGLSRDQYELTVVGIAVENTADSIDLVQLVGDEATETRIMQVLYGVDEIYTYNGSRFDLPFIKARLGLDIAGCIKHTDLMRICWKHKLKGGLKSVERQLGIPRSVKDVDGWMAVQLWWQYVNNNDEQALHTLLAYNAEDVLNLRALRVTLNVP
jgi:uncharacterized protein